jgi:hypothetical protein
MDQPKKKFHDIEKMLITKVATKDIEDALNDPELDCTPQQIEALRIRLKKRDKTTLNIEE